tara:strand:- start:165 stop:1595 length:1431 start_codon:yes stop_codon:yes gene_type:complete
MSPQHYKSIASNASFLVSAQLIVRLLRGFYIVLLIRYLGPELYGIFQYVQNWYVTFTPLTLFGIGAILSREIGKNPQSGKDIISATFVTRFLSGLFFSAAALILGLLTEPDPDIQHLMIVFAALILARALVNWIKEVFIAYEKTKYHVAQVTLSNLLQIGLGVGVMMQGGGMLALASVYIGSLFVEFLISFIFIHRKIIHLHFDMNFSKIKSIITLGLPIGIAVALNRWMLFGPTIIGRYALDYKSNLGQISVVLLLLFFASLIVDAILNAALPVLSRMMHQQQRGSSAFINITLSLAIPLCCFIALGGTAFSDEIILILFGPDYALAATILGPALWLLLPYVWISAISQMFILRHDTLRLSFWALLGALWMSGLLPVLILKYDILGVIFAIGIGMGITVSGLCFHGLKREYIHPLHLKKMAALGATALLIYIGAQAYLSSAQAFGLSTVILLPFIIRIAHHGVKKRRSEHQEPRQ